MYLVADPGEGGGGGPTPEKHYYAHNRRFLDIAVFLLLSKPTSKPLKNRFQSLMGCIHIYKVQPIW